MVNQWVQFVRQFAKDNNISYGCAISEAGPAYRNMKRGGDTRRERVEMERWRWKMLMLLKNK